MTPLPHVIAIDIDLHSLTAVQDLGAGPGVLADRLPLAGFMQALQNSPGADVVLIETAGPVMHHAESHSFRRWLIYNAMVTGLLYNYFRVGDTRVLVSPSTLWTQGYSEPKRHAVAGMLPLKHKNVTRKGKTTQVPIYAQPHDIRECRCMLDFYRKKPTSWVPLLTYVGSL